jgi:hypothetical protein
MLALTRLVVASAGTQSLPPGGAGSLHPRLGPDARPSAAKIANTLLAASPPLGKVASSALAQRGSGALAAEAARLCAAVVATGTPAAAQLTGAATWPQVHAAAVDAAEELELCDADLSEDSNGLCGGVGSKVQGVSDHPQAIAIDCIPVCAF